MIAKSTIEEVRAYSDIVSIINEYVPLKKRGRNYIGLCPFHSEKTPSFTVSPEKQIFHCFGCHESGNLISFIMKIDHLSFLEAIEQIAKRVGIEIKKEVNTPISPLEKELIAIKEILYSAREIFKKNLQENQIAKDYFLKRGLDEKVIKSFHLGLAPSNQQFLSFIKEQKYNINLVVKSGLCYKTNAGDYIFRFRNRLIFPIIDISGRTLGFGGRIFEFNNKQIAKYVNTEETPVFSKRKLLYGLNQAKHSIQEEKSIILMEGYMDVITAHKYGFTNAIGSMGTALTHEQIQKLSRLTDTIYIAFDSDTAGRKASQKNMELLTSLGLKVFYLSFSSKDPADFLLEHGANAFRKVIQSAKSFFEFKLLDLQSRFGTINIEDRSRIIDEMIPFLKKEKDMIIKKHYIYELSKQLNVNSELILAKTQKVATISNNRAQFIYKIHKETKFDKAEKYIIYSISTDLVKRKKFKEDNLSTIFINTLAKELLNKILNTDALSKDLLDLDFSEEEKKLLANILIQVEENEGRSDIHFQDCIKSLQKYKKDKRVQEIKNYVRELEKEGNKEKEVTQLLQEMNELIRG